MDILLLILFLVGVGVAYIALMEDKIFKGYNPEAVDRDGDGIVQEGTKFERPAKKRPIKKAAVKKKAPKKK